MSKVMTSQTLRFAQSDGALLPGSLLSELKTLNFTTRNSEMARLKGFEPLTHSLEGCCSIHLSYRRIEPFEQFQQFKPFKPRFRTGRGERI